MTTKQLTLPVTGMTCASCASRIERGLKKVGGVETAQVNLASEQATITYDPKQVQPHELVAAVEKRRVRRHLGSDRVSRDRDDPRLVRQPD